MCSTRTCSPLGPSLPEVDIHALHLRVQRATAALDLRVVIGDAGASSLVEALKANKTLTTLSVGDNSIGDAGMGALWRTGHPTRRRHDLWALSSPPLPPLTLNAPKATAFLSSGHTSNWAVLVCSSRSWFNYRHVANTLSMYRSVKRLGIPDSNIILMLADDMACNPRNPYPGVVFNDAQHALDLYGQSVEVDYRGYDVTVENFLRVLTGRHDDWVPRRKRLLSDDASNVFVYLTGHGGDEFLKFQDQQEVTSTDIADAFAQMAAKGRYRELLLMADTCQAATLANDLYSPRVIALGSSALGEPSWSYLPDADVGLTVIDRFTHFTLDFLERVRPGTTSANASLAQLLGSYSKEQLRSTATPRLDLFTHRPLHDVRLTDFLGSVARVQLTPGPYPGFEGRTV